MTEAISTEALWSPKDIPPPTFENEKGGRYMMSVLAGRPLWRNREAPEEKNPDTLFINLQRDSRYVFNSHSGKTEMYNQHESRDGFSSVIVVSGEVSQGESLLRQGLMDALMSLKTGGSVFIFEKFGGERDKTWREEILKKIGLVEGNILNSGRKVPSSIFWEAHMPREGLNESIDLLESGPFWIHPVLHEMVENYKKVGFRVDDMSELLEKVKKSTFPLKDIYRIRDGMGVVVSSTFCPTETCQYRIDTSGNIYTLNECGEEHSRPDLSLAPKDLKELVGKKSPEDKQAEKIVHKAGENGVPTGQSCGDCGEEMLADYFMDEKTGKLDRGVYCPKHHGGDKYSFTKAA